VSAPAQVTEAHRKLAKSIGCDPASEYCPQDVDADAQLIADSEAKAVEHATNRMHEEELKPCMDACDQLRAEVERLKAAQPQSAYSLNPDDPAVGDVCSMAQSNARLLESARDELVNCAKRAETAEREVGRLKASVFENANRADEEKCARLAAENESKRLRKAGTDTWGELRTEIHALSARAERAEAKLAKERARFKALRKAVDPFVAVVFVNPEDKKFREAAAKIEAIDAAIKEDKL